jgi:predicted esterase
MRALLLVALFAPPALGQPFDVPKAIPPDAETLKQIEAKRAELAKAIAAIPEMDDPPVNLLPDIEVYAKAAEWIVRHGEWFTKDSGKQTLAVLDAGLARAKAAAEGKAPWREIRNKPVIRGYRSKVDGSVQPYSVTIPAGWTDKDWRDKRVNRRADVVLHGRDQTLTEVKFIAAREAAKPAEKANDFIVLEPYGRGNNAYRWAGETDVFEMLNEAYYLTGAGILDDRRYVLRGFSMGGAGVWHLGLHHPAKFAALNPGAGFTTTHGKVKFDGPLPEYVEKCLHIYDAADYAENVFNVPVVAYSGANDPQKAAADNVEAALKGFAEPYQYTHLVAPGLEHKMPPEWQAKAAAWYAPHVAAGRPVHADRVRFVTYTTRFDHCDWVTVQAMDRHYARAVVDARRTPDGFDVRTENVRRLRVFLTGVKPPLAATIDGQVLPPGGKAGGVGDVVFFAREFEKAGGKWAAVPDEQGHLTGPPYKRNHLSGPIDDAFMNAFEVVGPSGPGWPGAADRHAAANFARFGAEWDKFLRGNLPARTGRPDLFPSNLVLFGDPASNPLIAEVVEKLPITWTKDKLVVDGVEYDPKTHVPVLIYPNPLNPYRYVVINSGHTFHAKDFQGTNALLYPRLGDWAVLKPTPTAADPAAAEVVAAGLFDENWQFPKK